MVFTFAFGYHEGKVFILYAGDLFDTVIDCLEKFVNLYIRESLSKKFIKCKLMWFMQLSRIVGEKNAVPILSA